MIPLSEEQIRAMQSQPSPVHVVNPHTQEVYVLIRKDVYELTRSIIDGPNRGGWEDQADDDLIKKPA